MPIHDWTRVDGGIFHAFHQRWISAIGDALNGGVLPKTHYALPEQVTSLEVEHKSERHVPDVLALEKKDARPKRPARGQGGGAAVLDQVRTSRPKVTRVAEIDVALYRRKKTVLTLRHVSGDKVVAVIELVSPGNKADRIAYTEMTDKATRLLDEGVHLLMVDVFPPTRRDPHGLLAGVWEAYGSDVVLPLPPETPLSAVAFEKRPRKVTAHESLFAVGQPLPDMPAFLEPGKHVLVPLEATYTVAWSVFPERWRDVIAPPAG